MPHAIPRLKMPEKMDIDTDVASTGELFMISACSTTLEAVKAIPHKAHNRMMVTLQQAAA